jgi:hypothetical protein
LETRFWIPMQPAALYPLCGGRMAFHCGLRLR